ncbi:hypothetical protein MalM25_12800 [Planctomycetes bacterium MalM25]|nr:hypothetical protein MalM25_12800 [Planctomycetes bacterium MalM25]
MLKSLGPNSAPSSVAETFGDLVFCALIVLVLFVLALAIEVSQRVRAAEDPVDVVEPSEVALLSPEDIADLSSQLQLKQAAIEELRDKVRSQSLQVSNQLAALAGEQRFTGAREPASLCMAVDYRKGLYYFVPSRDLEHADTRLSGETSIEYAVRKRLELTSLAEKSLRGRGYKIDEAISLYRSFSQYEEVVPTEVNYRVEQSQIGVTYSTWLSDKISYGTDSRVRDSEAEVVSAILEVYETPGPHEESMYPIVAVHIHEDEHVSVGGVRLSARNLRDILISISGRGAMLDLSGLEGSAPGWLVEGALTPAGYIGKVPKAPE